jgi:hypothetical protein
MALPDAGHPLAAVSTAWRRSSHSESGNCVEVAYEPDGTVLVRDSKDPDGPVLRFSEDEWAAFLKDFRRHELGFWKQRAARAGAACQPAGHCSRGAT